MTERDSRLSVQDHRRDSAGLRYVYPVVSRRAGGVSIGINLNVNNACNWRCIYCQVPDLVRGAPPPVDLDRLEAELRGFIDEALRGNFMASRVPAGMRRLVDVALSGNGEPTAAAEFPDVIVRLAGVLAQAFPARQVKLRLITNGSLVGRDYVQRGLGALAAADGEAWFKLDGGRPEDWARINDVQLGVERVLQNLRECASRCATWVQTCVFRLDGKAPDEEMLGAYVDLLCKARGAGLRGVLLYGIARPSMQPEAPRLAPLSETEMESIAARIRASGLTVVVSP